MLVPPGLIFETEADVPLDAVVKHAGTAVFINLPKLVVGKIPRSQPPARRPTAAPSSGRARGRSTSCTARARHRSRRAKTERNERSLRPVLQDETSGIERTTVVDGLRMRWEEQGSGMPLVLVHGIPTSPRLWRYVVPRVTGARCLAWEMVGYGGSIPEGRDRDISVARQADYLLAWLQAIGVERAVLAGHDLGGGVVQIAAVRRPSVCAGLFLTNAIGYDSWPIPSVKAMRAMGGLIEHLPDPLFERVLALFYRRGHDNPERAAEALAVHWPFYARTNGAAAFIRQVRSLNVQDTLAVADRLPDLRVPARVVWGASDQFQKIRYGERFARDLAAPLHRIERGKHFTPEDHPEIVAREIKQLLEDVRQQASQQQ